MAAIAAGMPVPHFPAFVGFLPPGFAAGSTACQPCRAGWRLVPVGGERRPERPDRRVVRDGALWPRGGQGECRVSAQVLRECRPTRGCSRPLRSARGCGCALPQAARPPWGCGLSRAPLGQPDECPQTLVVVMWARGANAGNPAFDFLNDPEEGIYSIRDGKPFLVGVRRW